MAPLLPALLGSLLAATVDVAAGSDLAAAVAAAHPGDVIRLGPGVHAGSLGRLRGPLRISGAGAGVTRVIAPEGEDGAVVEQGAVTFTGLSIQAGRPRVALKVTGGAVSLEGVAAIGGDLGVYVQGAKLDARDVDLAGGFGLLLRDGEVSLAASRVRGEHAGIAQLAGRSSVRQVSVVGPSTEAGVTISGGEATLDGLVIRAPGPAGLSVSHGARVVARGLVVSGATEVEGGYLGDCVEVLRATLRLEGSVLTRCAGAALEATGGELDVRGVDATGGAAGCLVFIDRAKAALAGDRCGKRGPSVVSAAGSQVTTTMGRWLTDPVLWVECSSGATVHLGVGETVRQPCQKRRDPLDKSPQP